MNTTDGGFGEEQDVDDLLLPPHGYKTLCIVNLLSSSIASVLSIVLILAMTVPLLYPERRKNYSTYNLYLAFMAIPDLVSHALVVYLLMAQHHQWNPWGENTTTDTSATKNLVWLFDYPWDSNIYALSAASNLYINAFLTHEIYLLLRNSNARKKHRPPSIARVTQQASISYGLGILIFFAEYCVSDVAKVEEHRVWSGVYQWLALIYSAVIPLSFMVWISYKILRQELLRNTESMYEGRLKTLVVYFARIVLSDLLLWIPAAALYFLSWTSAKVGSTEILAYHSSLLFTGIQAIALFGCSMAKKDARRLITDLVCCGWVKRRQRCTCDEHLSRRYSSSGNTCPLHSDPYLGRFSMAATVVGRGALEIPSSQDLETADSCSDDSDDGSDNNNVLSPSSELDRAETIVAEA